MNEDYKGEQIVLSSGRLGLNARSDSAELVAKKYINLSAGDKVTIDVGEEDSDNKQNIFLVNAPRIQFGLDRHGVVEPVTKADELEKVLNELFATLNLYSTMVQAAAVVPGPLMAAMLTPATSFLQGRLATIQASMINFKSTKVFTV
jgi:hypothetical protein